MQNSSFRYHAFGQPIDRISWEISRLEPPAAGKMRVAMSLVPVNPSDLIPITGAYAHRIQLPAVVGYEGVGRVISAPESHAVLVGRRVLPLRGVGTWQAYVDCDPDLAIPVPDDVEDHIATRAYINPLAALTMLDRWPVAGKRVLLSGAGSMCAELLASWARQQGAVEVCGIYRSASRITRLLSAGIELVPMDDPLAVRRAADDADLVFDSLGGPVGSAVLEAMRPGSVFVGYGLLSGQGIARFNTAVSYHRFHLRDTLATLSAPAWRAQFHRLWPKLTEASLPPVQVFPIAHWKEALRQASVPGAPKSLLSFGELGGGAG